MWSFIPEAPGIHLLEEKKPRKTGGSTPALQKLAGATITGLRVKELDRIAVMSCEEKRLSGRLAGLRLVLEIAGSRADLYVVEEETSTIFEALSSSKARLSAGARYQEPAPPPGAAPLARSVAELEARLARGADLLAATGATPLLVREMNWLREREGIGEAEAFARIQRGIEEKRPVLYMGRDRPPLLSALRLGCQAERETREHGSFSEAMAEAVALVGTGRLLRAKRKRLETAIAKRLERGKRLREKLARDRAAVEEPEALRGRAERLLAGLSRAERADDGRTVVFPDPFDPEEKPVAITIDPRFSLPANAERLFTRARKAVRAKLELGKRIEAADEEISKWEAFFYDLRDAAALAEIEALSEEARDAGLDLRTEPPTRKPPAAPLRLGPRRFRSDLGSEILVGRSGRTNDELTFEIARASDIWLHASGLPGAHVVLRAPAGSPPEESEVLQAAELAAYFSRGREATAVDVLVTERRNVSRIPGAPRGRVRVKSGRTVRVAPRLHPEVR